MKLKDQSIQRVEQDVKESIPQVEQGVKESKYSTTRTMSKRIKVFNK